MCREDPITLGECRPANMPPATVPNVLPGPEILAEFFPPKPLDKPGMTSAELEGPVLLLCSIVDWISLANKLLEEVGVIELVIPGNPVGADTDGLISAAIEKSDVA